MEMCAQQTEFETFLGDLRPRALAGQISARVFDAAFENMTFLPEVLAAQENQPEFAFSLRGYFVRSLPATRVAKGRAVVRERRDLFNRIEARFGVGAQTIIAIWGLETNYGRQRGQHHVLAALATLAWRGRRKQFFEDELLAALAILQDNHISTEKMIGSWAGAMGHGQFMPSSFQAHAVDFDRDGRADIWHDDPTDGLASIANYLAENGWQNGASWGAEIILPDGFDYTLSGLQHSLVCAEWVEHDITLKAGGRLANYGPASVLLPAGANGPAFLVFTNFKVLLSYNNAVFYALAVGMLADRIAGSREKSITMWPDQLPLSRADFAALQQALSDAGHPAGSIDGLQGPDTARAICAFQKAHGLPEDGHGAASLLTMLQGLPR